MILQNDNIIAIVNKLGEVFESYQGYLPSKVNFYIQKNINILAPLAQEIEEERMRIITHYGYPDPDNVDRYKIKQENVEETEKELIDLLTLEQDCNIHMIKLSDIEKVDFTLQQMNAIMFMIEEDEEPEDFEEEE